MRTVTTKKATTLRNYRMTKRAVCQRIVDIRAGCCFTAIPAPTDAFISSEAL